MIRVESIIIKEFRGIRDLTLELNRNNFAVCGPNGTGKSGVVDAIEFALTGDISRLTGTGSGEVSLKKHAPHVDRRNDPDKTQVTIRVFIPSLNKTATLERNLKNPTIAKITPSDPDIVEILNHVRMHPEIVLSRREIIRYVLATPGKRAEEIQALLHLDRVEKVRTSLQKIANDYEKQLPILNNAVLSARDKLLADLNVSELTIQNVLMATNARREILGLPLLEGLAESSSLKDGMATPVPAKPERIPKAQALVDIRAASDALDEIKNVNISTLAAEAIANLKKIATDPAVTAAVKLNTFYSVGLEITETDACPFCDNSWDLSQLKQHVQAKIGHLKEIAGIRKAAEIKIMPLISIFQKVKGALDTVSRHVKLATSPIDTAGIYDYSLFCKTAIEKLTNLLPIQESINTLSGISTVPPAVLEELSGINKIIEALPEQTKQDSARDWLILAQEHLETWREAKRKQKGAKEQAERARKISDIYAATSDNVLASIYSAVEKDLVALYGFINRDDEKKFDAKLIPSMGKLGFNVDFYGRGYFPPGAYHSEGHQDGMGLCLYLALMRHLHGAAFTIAVLDDVLMSVDAAHRREVCALLKQQFPDTQFIMTTHDQIWLRHMKTEKIITGKASVQFKNWDVDHGPTRWETMDVWGEIESYLKNNDVRSASTLLRNYLEYESAEICHRLRAPVEFHGDAQYQLGDLLPAAIGGMKKLYAQAKKSANSWNQRDNIKMIQEKEEKFSHLVNASSAEQWQVNIAIHYNSWENFEKEDFSPVVKVFKELLRGFACPTCENYLRVVPERGNLEVVRCECGGTNFNLCEKKA